MKIPLGSSEGVLRLESASLPCAEEMENVQLSLFMKVAMSTVPGPCVQMGGIQPRLGRRGCRAVGATGFSVHNVLSTGFFVLRTDCTGKWTLSLQLVCASGRRRVEIRVVEITQGSLEVRLLEGCPVCSSDTSQKILIQAEHQAGPTFPLLSFPLLHTCIKAALENKMLRSQDNVNLKLHWSTE